jgi:hypothetical protein
LAVYSLTKVWLQTVNLWSKPLEILMRMLK